MCITERPELVFFQYKIDKTENQAVRQDQGLLMYSTADQGLTQTTEEFSLLS